MTSTFKYDNPYSAVVAFEVIPDDDAEITTLHKGLWIGAGGTLRVKMWESGIVEFKGLVDGYLLPIRVKKVFALGTTATDIVAVQ